MVKKKWKKRGRREERNERHKSKFKKILRWILKWILKLFLNFANFHYSCDFKLSISREFLSPNSFFNMTNDLDRVRCHNKYSHKCVDKDNLIKMTIIIVTIMIQGRRGVWLWRTFLRTFLSKAFQNVCIYPSRKYRKKWKWK